MLESLMMIYRDMKLEPEPNAMSALINASDKLHSLIDNIERSDKYDIEGEVRDLQSYISQLEGSDDDDMAKREEGEPDEQFVYITDLIEIDEADISEARTRGQKFYLLDVKLPRSSGKQKYEEYHNVLKSFSTVYATSLSPDSVIKTGKD